MAQKKYIKQLYENEEKSLREISRIMNLSFQTVRKYAYMEDWNDDKLPDVRPERHPVLKNYIPIIDEWLENDLHQPRKQRHTATRIHKRLVDEHGFKGSYSSVKKYVRKKKFLMKQKREGYLPLAQPMGHAQIDFGTFKYLDAFDKDRVGYALTITFPYSNKGYTQVFKGQNQECLLEGMKLIFNHIGGVPIRVKADNMSTAVVKILKDHKRILTEGFSRFMLHYRFESDFCNPASGNEKGNVENKVGYSRRNFFVPITVIENFEAYNKELLTLCEKDGNRLHYKHKRTINEMFKEEQSKLLILPKIEYRVYRYETVSVNKYGQVIIDTNKYAISPQLYGEKIEAKIYFDKIELYYEKTLLKVYNRSYKTGEEVNDWKQYVTIMYKKPGGVEHMRFFNQLPKLWQSHLKSVEGNERKSALLLLMEIVQDDNADLCNDALEMAKSYGRVDSDSIRQCYYQLSNKANVVKPLLLKENIVKLNYDPDLSTYDHLTGGVHYE